MPGTSGTFSLLFRPSWACDQGSEGTEVESVAQCQRSSSSGGLSLQARSSSPTTLRRPPRVLRPALKIRRRFSDRRLPIILSAATHGRALTYCLFSRKHTGERPFTCHCGKQFSRLDNLRQHAQTVHADKQDQNERMMSELTSLHATMTAAGKGAAPRGKRSSAAAHHQASAQLGSSGMNIDSGGVGVKHEDLGGLGFSLGMRPGTSTGYEASSDELFRSPGASSGSGSGGSGGGGGILDLRARGVVENAREVMMVVVVVSLVGGRVKGRRRVRRREGCIL